MENVKFIRPNECDLGENWEDYFLEIRSIKKGEIFYECCYGKNIELIALEDAKKKDNGWYCLVECLSGKVVEIFISADTKYNAVSFFRTPQYLEYNEKEGYVYPII